MKLLFFIIKYTFLAIFIIALTGKVFSQTEDSIKPVTKINKEFLVVAHIVYNEDTVAGIDSLTIATQLAATNLLFSPVGASFKLCQVDYIYNFQYDVLDYSRRPDLLSEYWIPNRINMFFVTDITGGKIQECGDADIGGITSTGKVGIIIKKDPLCATAEVFGHELGHYFSLEHTFEDADGLELVNQSNCQTTGDKICDTPADPYSIGENIFNYVIKTPNSCIYISQKMDTNNDYYSPDVCNIMSYYYCGTKFTLGQYEKMANYYLSNPFEW